MINKVKCLERQDFNNRMADISFITVTLYWGNRPLLDLWEQKPTEIQLGLSHATTTNNSS